MNPTLAWIIIAAGVLSIVVAQLAFRNPSLPKEQRETRSAKLLYRAKDIISLVALFVAYNIPLTLGSAIVIGVWTLGAAQFGESKIAFVGASPWSLINGIKLGLLLPSFVRGFRLITV